MQLLSAQSLTIDHCPHRKNIMKNLINGVKSAFNPKTVVSELATVRKNHVKCEVTLIPIYLNLVQINDK